MASTWQVLSSLHLLCNTTMVELSVHLYHQRVFTESVTKASATWSPVFKAYWRLGNDCAPGLALERMFTPPALPLAALTSSLDTSSLTGLPASACICTGTQNRHQRALWASVSPKGVETAAVSWKVSLPHSNRAKNVMRNWEEKTRITQESTATVAMGKIRGRGHVVRSYVEEKQKLKYWWEVNG